MVFLQYDFFYLDSGSFFHCCLCSDIEGKSLINEFSTKFMRINLNSNVTLFLNQQNKLIFCVCCTLHIIYLSLWPAAHFKIVRVNKFHIPTASGCNCFPVCCTSHWAAHISLRVKWKRRNINFITTCGSKKTKTRFSTCSQHLFISSEHFSVVLKQSQEINCAVYYSWTHAARHEADHKHSFKTDKLDLFCLAADPSHLAALGYSLPSRKKAFMDY